MSAAQRHRPGQALRALPPDLLNRLPKMLLTPGSTPFSRLAISTLLGFFWLILSLPGHSQELPSTSEAEVLWEQIERIHAASHTQETDGDKRLAALGHLLDESPCSVPAPERIEAAIQRSEAAQHEANPGLSLNGYASSGSSAVEPSERTDGYVELSWDVLKSGILESNRKAEEAQIRARINEIEGEIKADHRQLRCIRERVHERLLSSRLRWLTLKYDLMRPAHQIERRGYFQGWAHLDELMVSEEDLVRLRRELEIGHDLLGLTAPELSEPPLQPPLVDLDLQVILSAIEKDQRFDTLQAAQNSLVENEDDKYESRLRFFVRQNVDPDVTRDVSFGARFSVPLTLGAEDRRQTVRLRHQLVDERLKLQRWEQATAARSAYLDFQSQLDRAIRQHYRVSRAWERLRRSVMNRQIDATTTAIPLAVSRARALADARLEMVDALEVLYRRLFEVFQASGIPVQIDAFKPVRLQPTTDRRRLGSRLIYVWSESLNHLPTELLVDFLVTKGVDHAAVSGGPRVESWRLQRLRRAAEERGISVAVLRGTPAWALASEHERALLSLQKSAEQTGRLHLDIEPHLLPSYDNHPREVLADYLTLLEKLRQATGPQVHLSVSVPMHWPEPVYKRLAPLVDEAIVMAYGETNSPKLRDRLATPLSSLPASKTRIALRASDFSDEWQMERLIEALAKHTGVKGFAIHDLGEYMELGANTQ